MTDADPAPDLQLVRDRVADAYAEAVADPRTPSAIRARLREAALELDPDLPPHLVECPACGRTGLPESIREHDCPRHR